MNLPPAEARFKTIHPDVEAAAVQQVVSIAQGMLERAPTEILQIVERQARQLLNQRHEIQLHRRQIAQLEQQVRQLKQRPDGRIAPFRIDEDKRQTAPKRPGRKSGHAGVWRKTPAPQDSDEQIEVSLTHCPDCRAALDASTQTAIEQTVIEVPEVQPRVIRLRTYRNHCPHCQQRVASHHPLQVSTATGAAGTYLGPRALGFAASLNNDLGLTMRKSCRVLQQCFGITLSPGGLSQALDRMARHLQPDYHQGLTSLHQSDVIYTDETGWWVNGPGYSLWVLTNPTTTHYRVVSSRSRDTARRLIGGDFAGVLVSDCLAIYDDLTRVQHKCYAHHLKALSNALKTLAGQGSSYLLELRALLHAAMVLKRLSPELPAAKVTQFRQALEQRADALLLQPRGHPNDPQAQQEEKLRKRLYKQRDHLFTFLDYPAVEATNNRAERQLRPAVIQRKVSCGNKSEQGASTWAILTSLAATCAQRGDSFVNQVAQAMSLKPINTA